MGEYRADKLEWAEVRSQNYDKLVTFYRDVLGLPVAMEEEEKDYIQFRVGRSNTYLAILRTERNDHNFIPAIEVPDLRGAMEDLKSKGVKFSPKIVEGEHVRLVDFTDPDGNTLQLFEWKTGAPKS